MATVGGQARRRRRAVAGALAASLTATACVTGPPALSTGDDKAPARCALPAPGRDFGRAPPAAAGLDPRGVADAVAYAGATGAISIRVYRHGCLVAEGAADEGTSATPMPAWSMTKGVVSAVVGRAVQLGLLDVDDPIGPHLRAAGVAVDEVKGALTVRHLLTQTSGIRLPLAADVIEAGTTDSVAALLARPFEAVPGTTFLYAQTTVTALTVVIEGATGRDFQDFARDELFRPLGIGDDEWWWARDPAGNTQGFAFLSMTPRAFARIGTMLGRDGRWGDRRLIPSAYLDEATLGTDANPCYGFLLRSNRRPRCANDGVPTAQTFDHPWLPPAPSDTFGLSGMFDQETTVYPSLDMVVVRMGLPGFLTEDPYGLVEDRHPEWQFRFARLLMAAVLDHPQPAVPDWRPDPEPTGLDLARIAPVDLPQPWPPR